MSSTSEGRIANMCIDGSEDVGFCRTDSETAPWLALDFGSEVQVSSVVLINGNNSVASAARTNNANIRVSSTLPVSGSEMFTGGQLLGTFEGPGTPGQRIEVTGGTQLTGRYVVVQMNNRRAAQKLKLREVTAWSQGVLLGLIWIASF